MAESHDLDTAQLTGEVVAVALDGAHRFSKPVTDEIELVAGSGVRGDAHAGATVQHRSRWKRDAAKPNLRQVHLIHEELFGEVAEQGFAVAPGELGENITTRGLDLLSLPRGAVLRIGESAIEVTGLRNPCVQIDRFADGLMKQLISKDEEGRVVRKAGVMGVVLAGGPIRAGDTISVDLPDAREPLEPV